MGEWLGLDTTLLCDILASFEQVFSHLRVATKITSRVSSGKRLSLVNAVDIFIFTVELCLSLLALRLKLSKLHTKTVYHI